MDSTVILPARTKGFPGLYILELGYGDGEGNERGKKEKIIAAQRQ